MASPAFTCLLKTAGAAVAVTGAAVSVVSAGVTYRITTSSRRVIDPSVAVTVYDGVTPIAAGSVAIDFLAGVLTLSTPPVGTVTVDYSYLPLLSLAEVRSFDLEMSADLQDNTVMDSATVARSRFACLKDASGTIQSLDTFNTDLDPGAGTVKPYTLFAAGTVMLLDVEFLSGAIFRAWIKIEGIKDNATFDALYTATLTWKLAAQTALASGAGTSESTSFSLF